MSLPDSNVNSERRRTYRGAMEPEDPAATSEAEMRADLAALKKAVTDREALPRNTDAWQKAVEVEDRAIDRVRRWVSRP